MTCAMTEDLQIIVIWAPHGAWRWFQRDMCETAESYELHPQALNVNKDEQPYDSLHGKTIQKRSLLSFAYLETLYSN